MAAIITDQIRILNAKNFVAGVSTSTNSYYSFVGLTDPTAIQSDWDNDPPSPIDNFNNHNDFWDTAIALKKINAGDVKQIVKKNSWTSGTTYDYYRHDYSITNPPKHAQGTSLYSSNYFVLNSDFRVYICLKNGTSPEQHLLEKMLELVQVAVEMGQLQVLMEHQLQELQVVMEVVLQVQQVHHKQQTQVMEHLEEEHQEMQVEQVVLV